MEEIKLTLATGLISLEEYYNGFDIHGSMHHSMTQ